MNHSELSSQGNWGEAQQTSSSFQDGTQLQNVLSSPIRPGSPEETVKNPVDADDEPSHSSDEPASKALPPRQPKTWRQLYEELRDHRQTTAEDWSRMLTLQRERVRKSDAVAQGRFEEVLTLSRRVLRQSEDINRLREQANAMEEKHVQELARVQQEFSDEREKLHSEIDTLKEIIERIKREQENEEDTLRLELKQSFLSALNEFRAFCSPRLNLLNALAEQNLAMFDTAWKTDLSKFERMRQPSEPGAQRMFSYCNVLEPTEAFVRSFAKVVDLVDFENGSVTEEDVRKEYALKWQPVLVELGFLHGSDEDRWRSGIKNFVEKDKEWETEGNRLGER